MALFWFLFYLIVVIKNLLLVLLLSILSARAVDWTNTPAVLTVSYPAEEITENLVIYVFTNSVITVPLLQWATMTVITNVSPTNRIPVILTPPRCYFVLLASNEWGASDFSEVLASIPPRQDIKPHLSR